MTPHQCLETHGSVAEWQNNQLTAWTSTQALWLTRGDAASAGQVSISQTRLICQHMREVSAASLDWKIMTPSESKLPKERGVR
jgi:CO/xanthine dehydrogenase Mo-binding subunit